MENFIIFSVLLIPNVFVKSGYKKGRWKNGTVDTMDNEKRKHFLIFSVLSKPNVCCKKSSGGGG